MGDINKILLTGTAESRPILTKLPRSGTPICHFIIRVDERFTTDRTTENVRANYFKVETLGRQASEIYDKVKKGGRYLIDGYLRQESSSPDKPDIVKIRSYGVISDPSAEAYSYKSGLEKALGILTTSRDLSSAVEAIKEVLSED
jgi:primosomal replication protein N